MPAKQFIKVTEDAGKGIAVVLKSVNKAMEQKAETYKNNIKSGG